MIVGNNVRVVVTGAGTNQIIGPNPRRVGLIISSSNTGDAWWSIGADAGNLNGLRIASGLAPVILLFDRPNDWITQPVSCWSSTAQTLNAVELVDRVP